MQCEPKQQYIQKQSLQGSFNTAERSSFNFDVIINSLLSNLSQQSRQQKKLAKQINLQSSNCSKQQLNDCNNNLYILLQYQNFLKTTTNLSTSVGQIPKSSMEQFQKFIQGEEVYITMENIHKQHNDFDYWNRDNLIALYGFRTDKNSKQSNTDQNVKKPYSVQDSIKIEDLDIYYQEPKRQKGIIKAKQQQINKNLQKLLQKEKRLQSTGNVKCFLSSTLTLGQKLKRSFCLYNRTYNQNRLCVSTNFELNTLLTHQNQGDATQRLQRINSMHNQNQSLFVSEESQSTYFQKLQICKQVAHAYTFSGYGFRRFLNHGFDLSMEKYRSYLTSMLRVVFRQLQKFVFESQVYKRKHKINDHLQDEFIYQPPQDKVPDNPRERVPFRQFHCLIRPLYHFSKHFTKAVTQTWLLIFKVTFSLEDETADSVITLESKPEQRMTQEEVIFCYEAIRAKIKEIVNQRMQVDKERMGLKANNAYIAKRKAKLEDKEDLFY